LCDLSGCDKTSGFPQKLASLFANQRSCQGCPAPWEMQLQHALPQLRGRPRRISNLDHEPLGLSRPSLHSLGISQSSRGPLPTAQMFVKSVILCRVLLTGERVLQANMCQAAPSPTEGTRNGSSLRCHQGGCWQCCTASPLVRQLDPPNHLYHSGRTLPPRVRMQNEARRRSRGSKDTGYIGS
jgi:hypothetical protein